VKLTQRTIAILFGALFFLSLGHQFILEQALGWHKLQVKKNIGSSKANRVLLLTQAQWDKAEKQGSDEVRLNGKMFDIKSIQQQNGHVLLYGHFDSKEDALLAKARAMDEQQKILKKSGFFAFFFFEELPLMETFRRDYPLAEKKYFSLCSFHSRVVPVDAPPPRCL